MKGYLCGRMAEYQNGCRCPDCAAAKAARLREWREEVRGRIQPGDGDKRHGTASGYDTYGCRCIECRRCNAQRKAEYKARNRRPPGYRPPATDIDPVAVERTLAGRRYSYQELTRAEQLEVFRRAADMTAADIASLLGISDRTVVRKRAALRSEGSGESAA